MSSVDLGTVKIPGWLPGAADLLIDQAEEFLGESDGKTRKQWVMDTLKGIARAHDIPGVPNWIERPLEDAVISLVIETIFAIKFKTITPEERAERRAKRRAKRAEKKAARQARREARKKQQDEESD